MQKIKLLITTVFALALSLAPAAFVTSVSFAQTANIQNSTCAGANLDATQLSTAQGTANCATSENTAAQDVNKLITLIVNIFSWVVGVVAVIAIIYGGFKYITSGGESGGVTAAKNTILYALVGLVIVALSQLIVRFVLGNVTKAV